MIEHDEEKQVETEVMKELYDKWQSMERVGAFMGCSGAKVSYRLRKAGHPRRAKGAPILADRRARNEA